MFRRIILGVAFIVALGAVGMGMTSTASAHGGGRFGYGRPYGYGGYGYVNPYPVSYGNGYVVGYGGGYENAQLLMGAPGSFVRQYPVYIGNSRYPTIYGGNSANRYYYHPGVSVNVRF